MARVELPRSNLRARRRRRRVIVVVVFVAAALLVLAALVGLSYIPFVRITAVNISGTQTLATSTIVGAVEQHLRGAHWYLFARSNIFLYPKQEIAGALLAQYPTLKSVDVHADNFHTVGVSVAERQPKALWCTSDSSGCYFIDEDGVVYATAPNFSEPIYVSYQGATSPLRQGSDGAKQYLTAEQFHNLSALVDALSQTEPNDPVRKVVVDTNGDVRAYFQKDFLLLFALKDASGDIFDRFTLAKKSAPFAGHDISEFEYLDLRFGDKLYYKEKDSKVAP